MKLFSRIVSASASAALLTSIGFTVFGDAAAHEVAPPTRPPQVHSIPASFAVQGQLTPIPGVTDLKFREFFKLPIGPRGLEPTGKLLGLNGKRIRMVGYMAKQEEPTAGLFILSPLPVFLGHEDESLADDLPPAVIFVHSDAGRDRVIPYVPGLIKVTGVLTVGNQEEADGRVSLVRLQLDPENSQIQAGAAHSAPAYKTSNPHHHSSGEM